MSASTSERRTTKDSFPREVDVFQIHHDPWPSFSGYQPLNRNEREIRLLTIDCRIITEDIICTLSHVPLSVANPFHALSYVWGPMHMSRSIILDNQKIRIRENLWNFLHNIRTVTKESIKVWVDCICIDQQSISERNFEVSMMGDIFGSADSVYAWLGTSTVESEMALSYVEKAKFLRTSSITYRQIQDDNLDGVRALKDIVGRQYWTRLWIIQEVVLAKRLWIFCGSQHVLWEDLQFVLAGSRVKSVVAKDVACQENANVLRYFKNTREERVPSTLSELVHRFRHAKCQDPRDKIYGILSLVEQNSRSTVQVDYAKPLLQVLLETYSSWASEGTLFDAFLPSQMTLENPASTSYSPTLFFQDLSMLFDESALELFYQDPCMRENVSTPVILQGTVESTPCIYQTIAMVNTTEWQIRPYSPASITDTSLVMGSFCYVTLVEITSSQSRFFIYTTAVPLVGDVIVSLANTMILMRSTPFHPDVHCMLAGRGIRLPYELTELLYQPCHFASQLLADSSYTLVNNKEISNSSRSHTRLLVQPISTESDIQEVTIRLNAAAISETMRLSEICRKTPSTDPSSTFWTWDVFKFGLQHQLLDMCRRCRLMYAGRSTRSAKDSDLDKPCKCIWTNDVSIAASS